ncbi:MAG: quinone-dependent dihydroorotate dehydrogenase [Candidatus Dojkabacteria bacterium]|nr:MAG: quinone-dependent dihydroorotate dehydrogenase [Candidatus Dojkabacteria bacterium]
MILSQMFGTSLADTIYQRFYKPHLFRQDPETVHDKHLHSGTILGKSAVTRGLTSFAFSYSNPALQCEFDGVKYLNPVGLSAGFDKDANLMSIMPSVGFGFMDVGSVTYKPYEGNPQPRLYRLPKSEALVVYYGLKNEGSEVIIERVAKFQEKDFHVNISIAKTNCKETSTLKGGIEDYYQCYKLFADRKVGSAYEINISCPNTFGGEPFTTPDKLDPLLAKLRTVKTDKPLYIKMPINLDWGDFDALLQVAVKYKVNGVVIGNLTKVRDARLIKDEIPENIKGGISGKPTQELSDKLIYDTYAKYGKDLTIVGVGGIFSAEDAYRKIRHGASLVQLITGMIYQGPQLIGKINKGLVGLMQEDGYATISEAVGADHRH